VLARHATIAVAANCPSDRLAHLRLCSLFGQRQLQSLQPRYGKAGNGGSAPVGATALSGRRGGNSWGGTTRACGRSPWLYLLAPFWSLLSPVACSPLLRAILKPLGVCRSFKALAVPLTIKPVRVNAFLSLLSWKMPPCYSGSLLRPDSSVNQASLRYPGYPLLVSFEARAMIPGLKLRLNAGGIISYQVNSLRLLRQSR
jgi:hypothetical protein